MPEDKPTRRPVWTEEEMDAVLTRSGWDGVELPPDLLDWIARVVIDARRRRLADEAETQADDR